MFATYMRMFKGRLRARNCWTKDRTDERELRSILRGMILAWGVSCKMELLRALAAFKFRAGIITQAPLFASTLAVSAPIPEVAPVHKNQPFEFPLRIFLITKNIIM